jgi:hypothetical protein
VKWNKGTGNSAQHFIVSECGRWQICKSAGPVYTLALLGGKYPELIKSGTLEECKREAIDRE